MIMLSARLKTFLVCLCTFLKKPAFSVSFCGGHALSGAGLCLFATQAAFFYCW